MLFITARNWTGATPGLAEDDSVANPISTSDLEPGITMPKTDPSLSEAFAGFSTQDLRFLTGLAANNDRAWFTAHRAVYDEGLKPAVGKLIAALNPAFAARDLPFVGDPKKSVFRI